MEERRESRFPDRGRKSFSSFSCILLFRVEKVDSPIGDENCNKLSTHIG